MTCRWVIHTCVVLSEWLVEFLTLRSLYRGLWIIPVVWVGGWVGPMYCPMYCRRLTSSPALFYEIPLA